MHEYDMSQHGEQPVIVRYFFDHPPVHKLLVDVGAFGKALSNSWAMLNRGWKGILVDADPSRCDVVRSDFRRQDVEVICVGVGDCNAEMDFHLHSELGHNSFLENWYPQDKTGQTIKQKVRLLADILSEREVPHDFGLLSIDTEGMDERIVRRFLADSLYRPQMIVTECTSYSDANGLFLPYGYEFLAKTGNPEYGNLIYVRRAACAGS